MDYLIVILILGCMFVISNSIAYFSLFLPQNRNLVSLIYAGLLFYPIAKYFIKISEGANDFDFLGIFMEGMTVKICTFAIGVAILHFCNTSAI
jgi:O-antigen/teichoic acid export membrane protein